MIKIWIDGEVVETEEGETILEVARKRGIYIPTLCYHEHLLPIGSCRLCVVEIEGYDKPQTSCTTWAIDGMRVKTKSDRLFKMRQEFLNLILMDHPLDCPQCDKAGVCKLQDLVYEHEIEKASYRYTNEKDRLEPYATPLIRKWNKRCVLCMRCFHACREISGRGVLDVKGKGFSAKIEVSNPEDCISCGECLAVCPVGALTEALSPKKTRPWMSEKTETTCAHCGFGCSIVIETQDSFVTKVTSETERSPNKGSLCVRGRFGYDYVNDEQRIEAPYIKVYDEVRSLSLEDAKEDLVRRLRGIDEEGGTIGFLISPRVTNEEIYVLSEMGKSFKRSVFSSSSYFGTTKVIKAMEESGIPLKYEYDDVVECDLIVILGCKLLLDNHVFGNKIREAIKKNGTKIIVVDVAPTAFTGICDLWVKTYPGTEDVFIDGIASNLLKEENYPKEKENIEGFHAYKKVMEGIEKGTVTEVCTIEERVFDKATKLINDAKKVGLVFEGSISLSAIRSLLNLSILKNMQVFPISPQANALGISMILKDIISPVLLFKDKNVRAIIVYEEEPFDFLNADFLKETIGHKEFIAHFTFLPTPISFHAHLVLPSGSFADKQGTFVSGNGFLRMVKRARKTSVDSLSIIQDVILRLTGKDLKDYLVEVETLIKGNGRKKRFLMEVAEEKRKPTFKALAKDLFKSPYIGFSKGVGLVHKDAIFISNQDAMDLGISEGEEVFVENEMVTLKRRVSILSGLKKGVVLIYPFKDRDLLKLFGENVVEGELKIRKA